MYFKAAATIHLYVVFSVHRHQRHFSKHLQYTVRFRVGVILDIILDLVYIHLDQRLLRHDFHSFQFIISLSGEHCPQINDSNRWFQSELFRDGRFAYRRNSNDVISRTYIQFLLKPTIGTRHRHLDSLVRCSFFSNLNSSVWFSILSQ